MSPLIRPGGRCSRWFLGLAGAVLLLSQPLPAVAQTSQPGGQQPPTSEEDLRTTEAWNQRLKELLRPANADGLAPASTVTREYLIGPEDLLEITVFEAPELNRQVRVSAGGEISLPLLGAVRAAGLSPRGLESVLEELLRRTYMKEPHVGVYVREMESHAVSVFGAVQKPGVFQVRSTKSLLEVLSMAQGLAEDAGDAVIVMRASSSRSPSPQAADPAGDAPQFGSGLKQASPGTATAPVGSIEPAAGEAVEINLKDLLESGDPSLNVPVYAGDIVKVTRAGIVYVVGEVQKPGGFVLKSNENISVLQVLALAEGLTRTSAKSHARIIRTEEATGERAEIPIDLGKILAGKNADPMLQPKDIVFVPNSAARSAFFRGLEAVVGTLSGVVIYRR